MNNMIKKENGRQPATFGSVVDQIFQNNLSRFFDDEFWGFNGALNRNQIPVNIRKTNLTTGLRRNTKYRSFPAASAWAKQSMQGKLLRSTKMEF